jgi:hypothetical protein
MRTKVQEQFKCECGKDLGVKEGSWFVYPSPLICGCGKDNTTELMLHMIMA